MPLMNLIFPFITGTSGQDGKKGCGFQRRWAFTDRNTAGAYSAKKSGFIKVNDGWHFIVS
jgi:hypothetical protein